MNQTSLFCIKTMQQGLISLISIADHKAGVLMGANFLVVSILVSQIASKGYQVELCIPLFFSLFLIFLSMRVLSPKFYSSNTMPDNLLFFRHVASMQHDDYISQMMENFKNKETVYKMMLLDSYQVSKVLNTKHKNLQQCFRATYLFISIFAVFVLLNYFFKFL